MILCVEDCKYLGCKQEVGGVSSASAPEGVESAPFRLKRGEQVA